MNMSPQKAIARMRDGSLEKHQVRAICAHLVKRGDTASAVKLAALWRSYTLRPDRRNVEATPLSQSAFGRDPAHNYEQAERLGLFR